MSFLYRCGLLVVWFLNVMIVISLGDNISSNVIEKARVITTLVLNSAIEAGTLRDMAIVAVRNAMAAENDAEEIFLASVKAGDKNKQVASRKALDQISESVEESKDILQKIADYASEVNIAAELAKQREKTIISIKIQKETESELKKLERLADAMVKVTGKARALADVLKKQWLLPISQSKSSVSPSTESAK